MNGTCRTTRPLSSLGIQHGAHFKVKVVLSAGDMAVIGLGAAASAAPAVALAAVAVTTAGAILAGATAICAASSVIAHIGAVAAAAKTAQFQHTDWAALWLPADFPSGVADLWSR